MRRISLSLALLGAVTAAGCGGGTSDNSGSAKGVAEGTFTLTIQNGQNGNTSLAITGGYVTSSPAGIDCGMAPHAACIAPFANDLVGGVVLTATPDTANGKIFLGWAGDCQGDALTCTLSGKADKYVLALFGSPGDRFGHANWSDPLVHGAQAAKWVANDPAAYACTLCHGANLQGAGLAPSCSSASCHGAANPAHPTFVATQFTNGPSVTTACVKCHAAEASDFMQTQHWTWKGPTPQLAHLVDFTASGDMIHNPGDVGKANLINGFCVSIASNEKRCDQCHAGYGTTMSARAGANATDPTRVDCLICHAGIVKGNMTAQSPTIGYSKIAGNYGNAAIAPTIPATGESLAAAANSVALPSRSNCGFCHFNAGGADSVKIMSTSLEAPSASVDVHMSPAGSNLTCRSCHAAGNHKIKGAGLHVPTNTARLSCQDCHPAPHATAALGATINGHLDTVACQTCHIPAYSRGQPGKIAWDWATAGRNANATIYKCLDANNVESDPDPVTHACAAGTRQVKAYDPMKGHFKWGINVKPTYAWYNGKMAHVTTHDKGALTGSQTGLSESQAITLTAPLGSATDATAKIFPFKLMKSRQAVYVDGANSFVIAPNVFNSGTTPSALWTVVTGTGYSYTPAAGEVFTDSVFTSNPLAGTFVGASTSPYPTSTPFDTLLSAVYTAGATAAGQIASGVTLSKFDGTKGWDFRFTQMYMDLEHEVAPKADALGCTACHSTTPVMDFTQLGYTCADPQNCPKRP